jgi:nicotinamidase-related amidase
MPLTELDPVAALVVIDLQKGIVPMAAANAGPAVVGRAAELASTFRLHNLPVVLVNVVGMTPGRTDQQRPNLASFPAGWSDLTPELGAQPQDILISKRSVGAFQGTALDAELRRRNVTQIFLAGISTSAGVESTGRAAFDLGYHVVFVADAMTDRTEENHRHSIEKVFPRFGQVETAANVLQQLAQHQGKAAAQ